MAKDRSYSGNFLLSGCQIGVGTVILGPAGRRDSCHFFRSPENMLFLFFFKDFLCLAAACKNQPGVRFLKLPFILVDTD